MIALSPSIRTCAIFAQVDFSSNSCVWKILRMCLFMDVLSVAINSAICACVSQTVSFSTRTSMWNSPPSGAFFLSFRTCSGSVLFGNGLHFFLHLSLLPANTLEIAGLFLATCKYTFIDCQIMTNAKIFNFFAFWAFFSFAISL